MRRLALGLGIVVGMPATARAGRTEVIVGGGITSPRPSDYRNVTEALGYDRRASRLAYELEAALLHAPNHWLSAGPLVRFHYGTLDAPYEGVETVTTYGVSVAARVEADLFAWPRIFVWADPSYGHGWIGPPDARVSQSFWGVRAGVGLGSARERWGARLRVGYSYSPTTALVTPWTGPFDWGGWLFQLDGVFRVG